MGYKSTHTDVSTAPTNVGTSGQEPRGRREKARGSPKPKEKKKAEEEAAAAKSWLAWKSRVAYPLMSCLASLSVLGRSAAASAAGSGRCCHHGALELLLRRIASQLARVGWGDGDGRTGDRDDGAGVCQCAPRVVLPCTPSVPLSVVLKRVCERTWFFRDTY